MEQHYFDLQMSSWKSAFPLKPFVSGRGMTVNGLAVKPLVLLTFAWIQVLRVMLLP